MFTGLIEEIGYLDGLVFQGGWGKLSLSCKTVLEGTKIGDSIAVNGVCLTVTTLHAKGFTADVMPETVKRSNLGLLSAHTAVHLERAMPAHGRFGGHMVAGHIDGMGKILSKTPEGNAIRLTISAPPSLLTQMVEKGSLAIDGISLTLLCVTDHNFSVGIIPHTQIQTLLLEKQAGDMVNLETDIIAKYVQTNIQAKKPFTITMDFLANNGF